MTIQRAFFILCCVLLLSSGALAGQSPSPSLTGADTELLRWAVTQGGLTLVVVLLILNEIRRSGALAVALKEATAALATHAEAARQQATSFSHLAESVRLCEAVRQMIADRGEP